MKSTNLKQQVAAWKNERIILNYTDAKVPVDGSFYTEKKLCYGFSDWFCKDSSLRIRAERLMPKVIKFLKANPNLDLEKHYVYFINNRLLVGPTYDEFRICNIKTGDIIFTVTPFDSHSRKAEIWGRAIKTSNSYETSYELELIRAADTYKKLFSDEAVIS